MTTATRIPRRWRAALWCGALVGAAAWVHAHEPVPAHACTAPSRPVDDQNDASWQSYLEAVDVFRDCISDHAQTNRRASRAHADAANAAVEDWNRYVKANLNVPEDFPWPPEGTAAPGVTPSDEGPSDPDAGVR